MRGRTRGKRFEAPARRKGGDDFEDYLRVSAVKADEDQAPDKWEGFDPAFRIRATRAV